MIKKKLQAWVHSLASIPQSPHHIAKSFSVGAFIGILPALGFPVAILAAYAFRLNKVAAVMGCLISNPWTNPAIYTLCFKVGRWFVRSESPIEWKLLLKFATGWPQELYRLALPLYVGALVVGLAVAAVAYVFVRLVVTRYQTARRLASS